MTRAVPICALMATAGCQQLAGIDDPKERVPCVSSAGDEVGLFDRAEQRFILRDRCGPPIEVSIDGKCVGADAKGTCPDDALPIAGDWDGDGIDTIGVHSDAAGMFWLFAPNDATVEVVSAFSVGAAGSGYAPLAGDFGTYDAKRCPYYDPGMSCPSPACAMTADRLDNVGLYARDACADGPSTCANPWFLLNHDEGDCTDITTTFGAGMGDQVLAGDWNGDGLSTPGFYRAPATGVAAVFLTDTIPTQRNDDRSFDVYFEVPVVAVAGDWDGDGKDSVGFYDPERGVFHLRATNESNATFQDVAFGPAGAALLPVAGRWK